MKDENKTKAELIKELKTLREEREKGIFKNISEYKEADKRLKESEEKCLILLENMMDGLVLHRLITDKNGHPVDYILEKVNKAAEKILSWNRKDIEGKKATEVYSGDTPFIERYAKVAQTGKAEYFIDYYPRFKKWYEINSFCPEKGHFANIFRDTTERKQAEEKLKEAEGYLKILFDYAPDAYYINDLKGNFIDGNLVAERLTGHKREELIGKSFLKLKLLSLADTAKATKLLAKNLRGHPTGPDEFVLNRKDNTKVTVEISTYPVKIKGKTLVLGIARDITEYKQAEEVLRENERRFRDVTESTLEWVWEVDASGKYIYSSPVCEKILGYKPEELLEKHFYELFVPEEQEQLKKTAFKAFANKQPFREFINPNIHKSGKLVWMSTSGVPILDKKGNLLGYRGSDMDITERKQTEKTLAEYEEKYSTVFENTGTATAIIEEDMTISTVNAQCEKLSGYSKEEIENKMKWIDLVIPEDLEEMKKYHIARRKAGENPPTEYEFSLIDKKGNIKNILLKIAMIPNTKKSIASLTDIPNISR